MKKLFHNESFKKYILISIICTAVLAAAGVFSYRRHTLAPERTLEKVLENILWDLQYFFCHSRGSSWETGMD